MTPPLRYRFISSLPALMLIFALSTNSACSRSTVVSGEDCRSASCRSITSTLTTLLRIDQQDAGSGNSVLAATSESGLDAVAWTGLAADGTSERKLYLAQWPVTAPRELTTSELGAAGASQTILLRRSDGVYLLLAGAPGDFEQSHLTLHYGVRPPFSSQVVDALGNTGAVFSAALEDQGILHIAWLETGAGQLRYAQWRDGFVQDPVVLDTGFDETQGGPGGDLDLSVSIAVNAGRTAISYYDASNGQLRVALPATDGTWHVVVPGVVHTGQQLTLDDSGRTVLPEPAVMRYDHLELRLNGTPQPDNVMAIASPTELVIADPDPDGLYELDYVSPYSDDYGRASAIGIADDGTIHIVFVNTADGTLEYLVNADPLSNRDWLRETIDDELLPGGAPALQLVPQIDSSGIQRGLIPFVIYQKTVTANLMLAFRQNGTWAGNINRLSGEPFSGFDPSFSRRNDTLLIAHRIFRPDTLLNELEILQMQLP